MVENPEMEFTKVNLTKVQAIFSWLFTVLNFSQVLDLQVPYVGFCIYFPHHRRGGWDYLIFLVLFIFKYISFLLYFYKCFFLVNFIVFKKFLSKINLMKIHTCSLDFLILMKKIHQT